MPFCRTGFEIKLNLSKFAEDFEFFVLKTLENYHQISHSGPWSATYDWCNYILQNK